MAPIGTLTKLHNDERTSVKAADLFDYVVLASVQATRSLYEQFVSYRWFNH